MIYQNTSNNDLTLTVEFPDDGVQKGVLRSHMAPPDRHLRCGGPWTWRDCAGLWLMSHRGYVSLPRSRAHDGHRALLMETRHWLRFTGGRVGGGAVILGPKLSQVGQSDDGFWWICRRRREFWKGGSLYARKIWAVSSLQVPGWEERWCLFRSPEGEGRRSGNISSCLTLGGAQQTSHPALQPAPVKRTGRAFRPASLEP